MAQSVSVSVQGTIEDPCGQALGRRRGPYPGDLPLRHDRCGRAFRIEGRTSQIGVLPRAELPGGAVLEGRSGRLRLLLPPGRSLEALLVAADGKSRRWTLPRSRRGVAYDAEAWLSPSAGTWFLRLGSGSGARTFRLVRPGRGLPVQVFTEAGRPSQVRRDAAEAAIALRKSAVADNPFRRPRGGTGRVPRQAPPEQAGGLLGFPGPAACHRHLQGARPGFHRTGKHLPHRLPQEGGRRLPQACAALRRPGQDVRRLAGGDRLPGLPRARQSRVHPFRGQCAVLVAGRPGIGLRDRRRSPDRQRRKPDLDPAPRRKPVRRARLSRHQSALVGEGRRHLPGLVHLGTGGCLEGYGLPHSAPEIRRGSAGRTARGGGQGQLQRRIGRRGQALSRHRLPLRHDAGPGRPDPAFLPHLPRPTPGQGRQPGRLPADLQRLHLPRSRDADAHAVPGFRRARRARRPIPTGCGPSIMPSIR